MKPEHTPRIHTTARRKVRALSPRKKELWQNLLPKLQIALPEGQTLDVASLFTDETTSYELEIGYGGGERLVYTAEKQPKRGFIGAEMFQDGIAKCITSIEERGLKNIRLYTDDARDLMDALPDASLDQLSLLFPDPWPKSRHWKRRIVQQSWLNEVSRVLKNRAKLFIATDHPSYLEWIMAHMAQREDFVWLAENKDDWATPPVDYKVTRYQQKALKEGRKPYYLNFCKLLID